MPRDARQPAKHGRDHCPGGADPIPCLKGIGDRHIEYLWGGPKWDWYDSGIGGPLDTSYTWVKDTTSMWNGYFESNANGAQFYVGAPLGPRWSSWAIDLCVTTGPDYGIMKCLVGTVPFYRTEAGVTEGVLMDGFDIPHPDLDSDVDPASWHYPGNGSVEQSEDFYDAVGAQDVSRQECFGHHMRITGDYGAMLTGNGDSDTNPNVPLSGVDMNGGDGVWWWFKFYVSGKNASSSGHRTRIHALRLVRVVGADAYPI